MTLGHCTLRPLKRLLGALLCVLFVVVSGTLHIVNAFCVVQVIPHNFGRQRPPVIASLSMVENKIRMCDVLNDIEVAQDTVDASQHKEDWVEMQPNAADEKYATLKADLKIIPAKDEEYGIIRKYCQVGALEGA